ncbi:Lrp/AsnC family transcriptional regulator [Streptomyces lactacystinicus]
MPPAHVPSSPGSPNSAAPQGSSSAPQGSSAAPQGPSAAPAGSTNDAIDLLDGRLIRLLAEEPRIGVLECSRRLQVARGTVQARLDRLQAKGVIGGFGPEVDPAAIGYPVTAFATLEISQGQGADVRAHLASVPEVLELHTITGIGDMLVRIVARSNADLQRVIDRVLGFDGIVRSSTAIVLENPVPYRILPLVDQAAAE